jgi:hypothetical protein
MQVSIISMCIRRYQNPPSLIRPPKKIDRARRAPNSPDESAYDTTMKNEMRPAVAMTIVIVAVMFVFVFVSVYIPVSDPQDPYMIMIMIVINRVQVQSAQYRVLYL